MNTISQFMLAATFVVIHTAGQTQVENQAIIQFTDEGIFVDASVRNQLDEIYESMPVGHIITLPLVQRRIIERNYDLAAHLSKERCRAIEKYLMNEGVSTEQMTIHHYNWPWPSGDFIGTDSDRYAARCIYSLSVVRAPNRALQFTASNLDPIDDQCESARFNNEFSIDMEHSNGLVIQIPPFAFESVNGFPIDVSTINIQLCSYQNTLDFVLGDVCSNNGKQMLESGRMVLVTAWSADIELRLKKNVQMQLFLPKDSLKPDMMAFVGSDEFGITNWNPSSADRVSLQTEEEVWEDLDSVDEEFWGEDEYYDSPFIRDMQGYVMTVSDLGWINCDRFYEIETEAELIVDLGRNEKIAVRLIFKDINSVLPGYKIDDYGKVRFEGIPTGEEVIVLAFGEVEKKLVMGSQTLQLEKEETIRLALVDTNPAEFKLKVAELMR